MYVWAGFSPTLFTADNTSHTHLHFGAEAEARETKPRERGSAEDQAPKQRAENTAKNSDTPLRIDLTRPRNTRRQPLVLTKGKSPATRQKQRATQSSESLVRLPAENEELLGTLVTGSQTAPGSSCLTDYDPPVTQSFTKIEEDERPADSVDVCAGKSAKRWHRRRHCSMSEGRVNLRAYRGTFPDLSLETLVGVL